MSNFDIKAHRRKIREKQRKKKSLEKSFESRLGRRNEYNFTDLTPMNAVNRIASIKAGTFDFEIKYR